MAFRKILVPLRGGGRDDAVLTAAVAAAKAFDAWALGFFARPDATEALPYLGEGLSAGVIQEIIEAAQSAAEKASTQARLTVEAVAAREGVPLSHSVPVTGRASLGFHTRTGVLNDLLYEETILSDLVISDGADLAGHPALRDALETVLLSARRPVMLLPDKPPGQIGAKIAIGWDGGLAAAHAVSSALPWLMRARAVEILTIGLGPSGVAEMDRLRDYLRLHGIQAVEHAIQTSDLGPGAALTEAAQRAGADMLVMGAYGHSRLREMILGGATRHILSHVSLPVFMAH